MNLLQAAISYLRAGLAVLPAIVAEKRPAISWWKDFQLRLPTEMEVSAWFSNPHEGLCLVTGEASGNLELIDFDHQAELYGRWAALVEAEAPGLLGRMVIERSQSGGRHVIYRCGEPVCGSTHLAQRAVPAPSDKPILLAGKSYKPRRSASGAWEVPLTLIETRGTGGLFLCYPTPGYELVQGRIDQLPIVTAPEREMLLEAARSLNELIPPPLAVPASPRASAQGERPGDAFNAQGDVAALLLRHGWVLARDGENQHWRRPGKSIGWSATLKGRVFYVFSSSAAPFQADRAYGPFAVYALLEHQGDYAAAARALRLQGYGGGDDTGDVDLTAITDNNIETEPAEPTIPDPGPLPEELLEVPGFICQVMDHTLATAPYPQPVLAFAAALTLQAFLAGRRVRDAADNRTNLYVLALANSGSGKDHPRKINQRICIEAGLQDCLGDSFASGEGIEDRMYMTPSLLFQTDEIDGLMNAINQASDARHESIMNALLKIYTSSNAV